MLTKARNQANLAAQKGQQKASETLEEGNKSNCSETKEELEVAIPQPDIFEPKKEKKHKNKPTIVFNSKEEELVFKA